MRRQNDESSLAHEIAAVAEDAEAVAGVVDDLAVVLLVLGVPVQGDANNLVADVGTNVADGGSGKSSALTVTASNDLSVGALAVGVPQESGHLGDGAGGRAIGVQVALEVGGIVSADALDPDVVGPQSTLNGVGHARSDERSLKHNALVVDLQVRGREDLTMLSSSTEPRAKMKMTWGQLPELPLMSSSR